MDDQHYIDKYGKLKNEGYEENLIYKLMVEDNLGMIDRIRIIRKLFGISLIEAKELETIAYGKASTLEEEQEKLVEPLKTVLDSIEKDNSD